MQALYKWYAFGQMRITKELRQVDGRTDGQTDRETDRVAQQSNAENTL